jgi:pimeloyl-ACP methyl ester carboxylesterase
MWHGGWCWKKVTPILRAAGHEVYTPTLTGLGERAHLHYPEIDMHTHIQDVVNVLEYEDLRQVILVGHSLAGFMVPAVAERAPERIAHIINLDGPLGEDGKAFKDLLPDYWENFRRRGREAGNEGWVPPIFEWTFGVTGADLAWMQSKLTPQPLKTWETPLTFINPAARSIPRTFISCTENLLSNDEISAEVKKYAETGWDFRFISTGHDAMITAPDELAETLIGLIPAPNPGRPEKKNP